MNCLSVTETHTAHSPLPTDQFCLFTTARPPRPLPSGAIWMRFLWNIKMHVFFFSPFVNINNIWRAS